MSIITKLNHLRVVLNMFLKYHLHDDNLFNTLDYYLVLMVSFGHFITPFNLDGITSAENKNLILFMWVSVFQQVSNKYRRIKPFNTPEYLLTLYSDEISKGVLFSQPDQYLYTTCMALVHGL